MAKYLNLERINKAYFDTRLYVLSKIYDAYGDKAGEAHIVGWANECKRSPSTIRAAINSLHVAGLVEVKGKNVRITKGLVKESQKRA